MALINEDGQVRSTGLVKAAPEAPPPAPIEHIRIQDPQYKATFMDSRVVDLKHLASYIQGSPWGVEYFGQVITQDSDLSGQQLSVGAAYQSYHRIVDFELRVTSPLATSQTSEDKTMQVQGSANVFSLLLPNEGDMFIASIGEGRDAVFKVTASVKKSIFNIASYEIEYVLVSDAVQVATDLRAKAVKTSYFHREYLAFGENPLVVESEHHARFDLAKSYRRLLSYYFKTFFSNEFKTMIVPGQTYPTYDPFLVKFLLEMFGVQDALERRFVRNLSTDHDWLSNATTIWDALLQRDAVVLNTVIDRAGIVGVGNYSKEPVMAGIRYTGILHVVYPKIDGNTFHLQRTPKLIIEGQLLASTGDAAFSNTPARYVKDNIALSPTTTGSIFPVTADDYYVLSEEFYTNGQDQSLLESMVWEYLKGKPSDVVRLQQLAQTTNEWGILEQFYYIPILLTLMSQEVKA